MSGNANLPKLDACGCCETGAPPAAIYNRPGQPALSYRLGTHAAFFERMVAALSFYAIPDGPNQGRRPLLALTTRGREDFSIALVDACAAVADVLAFYQERIANEGFLRTATERRSVLELARAIGYELKPGVAASAFLAFLVEEAAGAPRSSTVAVGTKVQSVPAPGRLPQTFETVEQIDARVEWNRLRPRMFRPQLLNRDAEQLLLTGTNLNLKSGDLLLIVVDESGIHGKARRISSVRIEQEAGRTVVSLQDGIRPPPPPPSPPLQFGVPVLSLLPFTAVSLSQNIVFRQWRERDLSAMIAIQRWQPYEVVVAAPPPPPPPPPLPTATTGVFALRVKAGIFGHNAPQYISLPLTDRTARYPNDWDTTPWEIWKDPNKTISNKNWDDASLYLERSETGILANSWAVLERPAEFKVYRTNQVTQKSLGAFSISGKATGLTLVREDGSPLGEKPITFQVRNTTVHAQSEPLELAGVPIDDPVAAGSVDLTLGGMVLGLRVGQRLAIGGELVDTAGVTRQEIITLKDIIHAGGYTTLTFVDPLQNGYVRKTVTLNANVSRSTHGETVARQVLGSGDGAQANQRFQLKRPPLTFVSAQTPSGAASTLAVRVNDLLWREAASLYGLDPRAESYALRLEDDGTTTVIFGDGQQGARLPSGSENVTASYRAGIGPEGQVAAGSLTLLQAPPLGIRSASNPQAASGAEAPEKLDQARGNAPRTVLTLDRIVSLRDYEDFARAFSGIGKARAAALWKGEVRKVHITVSGASGNPVAPGSDLLNNLIRAILASRDSRDPVDVQSYGGQYFNVSAKLVLDARYEAAKVPAAVEETLKAQFGFQQRTFGQGVSAAEVVAAIQNVAGVVSSDLDQLYYVTDPNGPAQAAPASFLESKPASWPSASGNIEPAQLLLINPVGIALTEVKL